MMKHWAITAAIFITSACLSMSAHAEKTTMKAKETTEILGVSALPNTPSGNRLRGWMKAASSGKLEQILAFMEANYDAEELKRFPASARAMPLVDGLYRFGAKHPIRVVQPGELETTIEGESALSEQWVRVKMMVSEKESHPIKGVMIEPIPTPADLREKKRPGDKEMAAKVRAFTERLAEEDKFSGVVLLAKGDKILLQKAYGYADKEKKIKNGMDTRFGLASMGKMFTAVAIAQLVEAGKLRYDDTVIKILPDYPNKAVAEKVTVHHLLTHTAGMGDFFDKPGIFEAMPKIKGTRDFLPFFADDPLKFEPGTGWDYSNAGFIVLGTIIEKVTGQDYVSYVREQIFKPAGMTHSFHDTIHGKNSSLAVGYTFDGGGAERHANTIGDTGGPAGGGASTAGDMLRFARALLDHKLIGVKSLETMTAPKAKIIYSKDEEYGYGFMLRSENGHPTFGHGGGFPGVCTQLEVYPKDGYVVVMLSNYDPMMGNTIADKARRMITAG